MSEIIADLQMCNGMQPEIEPGDILITNADSESVNAQDCFAIRHFYIMNSKEGVFSDGPIVYSGGLCAAPFSV